MTIDEAIKNNGEHSKAHRNDAYPDYYNALKLGIEALGTVRILREHPSWHPDELLPGETKD